MAGVGLYLLENIMHKLILSTGAALVLAGCTTTGNTEKGAAIGAAGGAAAGAIIGNNVGSGDAKTGAIIGGIAGAVGGGLVGREKDKRMDEPTQLKQPASGQTLYYDQEAGRYYFTDEATGRTYWKNGSLRSQ
jgi:uncharacterized protein YcfJ